MLGTRRLFEPGVYLNLGVILEIYGINVLKVKIVWVFSSQNKRSFPFVSIYLCLSISTKFVHRHLFLASLWLIHACGMVSEWRVPCLRITRTEVKPSKGQQKVRCCSTSKMRYCISFNCFEDFQVIWIVIYKVVNGRLVDMVVGCFFFFLIKASNWL